MNLYEVLFTVTDLNAEYEIEGRAHVVADSKNSATGTVEMYVDTHYKQYVWQDYDTEVLELGVDEKEGWLDFDINHDKRNPT